MTRTRRDPKQSFGSLRHRVRYHFDNLLARGTWATLVWLGAITLAAVVISALLLAIFRVSLSGSQTHSYFEDLWQSLLRVMDPGTMANDVGWGRRVLALLITVFGLLVAGTLIGVIAAGVEDRVERMRRGRSIVFESGHLVVLGASERLPFIVRQLVLAGSVRSDNVIVIMGDADPAEMYGEVRRVVTDTMGTRLVFRSGDTTRRSDIEMVRPAEARRIIVLAQREDSDSHTVKTVLAVGAELGGFEDVPIVVELSDPARGDSLVDAFGEGIHPLAPTQAVTRTAAFALRERGIGQVVTELFDFGGSDIHIKQLPSLAGATFGETMHSFAKARPIGRMTPDGHVDINPSPDLRIGDSDRLVLIADDDRDPEMSSRPIQPPHSDPVDTTSLMTTDPAPEHVLVIGWNALGAYMLADWSRFAPPSSTVDVVFDPALVDEAEVIMDGWDASRVTLTPTSRVPSVIERLGTAPALTTVLMLAYEHQDNNDDADNRTLLELVALRRSLDTLAGTAPRVIAQLTDVDNVSLVDLRGSDDFLISQAIGSSLIAQLAEQPERRAVYLELYSGSRRSIHLVPAEQVGLVGGLEASAVFTKAYHSGLLAIGWRKSTANGGELVLNPHESDHVVLGPGDDIVVIG